MVTEPNQSRNDREIAKAIIIEMLRRFSMVQRRLLTMPDANPVVVDMAQILLIEDTAEQFVNHHQPQVACIDDDPRIPSPSCN